ncbi:MAG: UvrD-helicase domain-containing protein [Lachnospiraceae bacterium]|nr:UvrD-helicase domain-containing protein [Lachnospiraceae bacterium]
MKTISGLVYSYSYKELSQECQELERRTQEELRTFRFALSPTYFGLKSAFDDFLRARREFGYKIEEHNQAALQKSIEEAYQIIGDVEGQKLDLQQMACIVKEPHSHLVIAGAGTGKTTTILGKVKYLLATGAVTPQDLLLLSFTNAAATEMKNRLLAETGQKIYVATFHKLGYDIIRRADSITPNVSQKDVTSFSLESLERHCQEREYQAKVMRYILYHRVTEKSEFEFGSDSEYQDFLETNPPTTVREERVKSYGEMLIANYLTEHGVRYEYEAAYPVDTRTEEYGQYHPDFFLPEYNLYIEYFGVDRQGNVPDYFSGKDDLTASEAYREGIKWKRKIHRAYSTTMIECYAFEHLEGMLLERLEEKLLKNGVKLQELSLQELLSQAGQKEKNVFSSLASTVSTVISLCRNRKLTAADLMDLCKKEMPKELILAEIIAPILKDYEEYLRRNGLVDFTDMLNRAEDLITSGTFTHKFRYVIVDEYQDLSSAQYRLLRAMRQQADYTLFCVGDDWQSIYRFAGSDIGYILNFNQYWGDSEQSQIVTTYRFSQRLIDISGQFIMENPNQIKKYIRSGKDTEKLVLGQVHGYMDHVAISEMADKLETLPKNSTVFFLGRYQFDVDLLRKDERFELKYDNVNRINRVFLSSRKDLDMVFYTAHRSKGLQADYVFIINNRATHMGFPSKVQNPPLVELLLEKADQYPDAEERRLFYVALTRARKRVYLVTYGKNISTFAKELTTAYAEEIKKEKWTCPWCGGQLRKVSGPYGEFIGCSNYRTLGCKYQRGIVRRG